MRWCDVSAYQSDVDFGAMRKAGATIVGLKATEGSTYIDAGFARRRRDAEAAGLLVLPYHFARPDNNSPEVELAHFLSVAGVPRGNRLPLCLDYEKDGAGSQAWFDRFVEGYKKRAGHLPIVYSGNTAREQNLRGRGTKLWIPAYTNDWRQWRPSGWPVGDVIAWQFTESGSFPGVSGRCDVNEWLAPNPPSYYVVEKPSPLTALLDDERKHSIKLVQIRNAATKRGKWKASERISAAYHKRWLGARIRKIDRVKTKSASQTKRLKVLRDVYHRRINEK